VALVDIIVAVVLLGSALAVMVGMAGSALSAQRSGEDMQIAANLIDEQLNLVLARGADDYSSRFPVEGPCEAPFERYRFQLDISGGQDAEAYFVTATVFWSSAGRGQSASVSTRIAPRRGDDPDPDRRPQETVDRL
jgi:hypothetical protein